jgi:LuxR family transcriptional regulator, maltose regulon positive regulatory protein
MTTKRVTRQDAGEVRAAFDITSGITLSRSLVPTLAPNFISRKRLFPLLTHSAPSTTVVIAPAGYGKTSLVAEWAHQSADPVIWMTITNTDSVNEMSALMIQATRNVLPGFAPWFERDQLVRPTEVVRRWGNELLETGKNYVFVIDNLRSQSSGDVDIAEKLVQQFPSNVSFVAIRRDPLESMYQAFLSRGPLHIIGLNELKFTDEEVKSLALANKIDFESAKIKESLLGAIGWPAAVAILIRHLEKSESPVDFAQLLATQSEPLRALALTIIDGTDCEVKKVVTKLSVVHEFNQEVAQVILGKEYSSNLINEIALEGNFFAQTSDPEQTYSFTRLMREIFLLELGKEPDVQREIHIRLCEYYEHHNQPNLALEHAFLAGDSEKISALFPNAARILLATGQGNDLVRWAVFAGDNSQVGLLQRATVEIAGHLASLEYHTVMSMHDQMVHDAKGTVIEGFINQIAAGNKAYIEIAQGRFKEFDTSFSIAMKPVSDPLMLGVEEQIGLLRLAAISAFIHDDTEAVESYYQQSLSKATEGQIATGHVLLAQIHALSLFQVGEYRKAFEAATIATSNARRNGFVGVMGPLPSMYVQARCLLEFSRPDEAFEIFAQIKNLAQQWKQWIWYFLADGYFARDLVLKGRSSEALEIINQERKMAERITGGENLSTLIDLSEIFIRYTVSDDERAAVLIKRVPEQTFTRQIQLTLDYRSGKKSFSDELKTLPTRTPKEKVWKYLAEASEVIDQEKLAMKSLKLALEVGAVIGAKETFLRQDQEIGNLIIKIAGENPTLYLEDLASAVTDRVRENRASQEHSTAALTKRELEVLRHLATERPISAIATTLHISQNTMKTHLKNLYRKMEVDGRAMAVEKARSNFIF